MARGPGRVALCDLSGGSRKEGLCSALRSLRLSRDQTPRRARDCHRPGPASEAGQSRREVPGQLYAPRHARAPRPCSPAPAAPRPFGTGSQATGRGPGRRQRSRKSHDFPAYINHSLFFSTGCRLKGAVSSFSPKGTGSLGCLWPQASWSRVASARDVSRFRVYTRPLFGTLGIFP